MQGIAQHGRIIGGDEDHIRLSAERRAHAAAGQRGSFDGNGAQALRQVELAADHVDRGGLGRPGAAQRQQHAEADRADPQHDGPFPRLDIGDADGCSPTGSGSTSAPAAHDTLAGSR